MAESRTQYVARKRRENADYRRRVEASEAADAAASGGSWFDRSDAVKRLVGEGGALAGLVLGMPRGAYHMVQDGLDAANFAGRLLDPYDADHSPIGHAAWDDVLRAGKSVTDYAQDRLSHLPKVAQDLNGIGPDTVSIQPQRYIVAPSAAAEYRRQFANGLNAGEGVFNVGALIGGIAELRSIPELRALTRGAAASDYLPADVSRNLAGYMDTSYVGMGSHQPITRATKLPGGKPVPKILLDSVFNRKLPPEGTPRGLFYRYHYAVDPTYHGGPVKRAYGGGGWSGKKLGWTKYGPLAQAWYGTPWQTKLAGTGLLAGVGLPVDQFCPGGRP